MILKHSDTKNKDFCVILSHFYVEKQEKHKFNILGHVVDYYKNLNAYIIFSSHGETEIPHKLQDKIDAIYWEQAIDRNELGRGHPKFCIKAFEMARERNFKKALKIRAEDILLDTHQHKNLLSFLGDKKMILSEQTSFKDERIGDLFMFGEVSFMHELWTVLPWIYSRDGLYNLYKNFTKLSAKNVPASYIENNCAFKSPQELSWVTVTDAWADGKVDMQKLESCFWGRKKGFVYYGGF
jgi:hypothetical protein